MDDAKILRDFVNASNGYDALLAVLKPWVEQTLRNTIAKWEPVPGLVYRGPADFLLQHGEWFVKHAEIPERLRGVRGFCYGMSIDFAAAWPKYKYYEGVAVCMDEGVPFLHAWNVSRSQPDVVVDRTRQDGVIYCGVEFSVERAHDATWEGDGSVLQDEKRGHPLFRQRWQGEDFSIQWPTSELLEIIKTQDKARFLKWCEANPQYAPPTKL